jgi:catechol 2,3-dioxygenase-like lactoylglutathione lyase family enzyme
MGAGAGVEGVGQVAIPVGDIARSTLFYRDVLGLPLLFEAGTLAFFDGGGVRLMFSEGDRSEGIAAPLLYYRSTDLQAAHESLVSDGVVVESEPHAVHRDERHELRMGFYHDPDGHLFGVMQEVPLG